MVYFLPQPMRCNKCGHTGEYSQSQPPAMMLNGGRMICPACIAAVLLASCGLLEPVQNEPKEK